MAESINSPVVDDSKPILIIGAGVVGLTLVQGCGRAGIPFQIFESLEVSSERVKAGDYRCIGRSDRCKGPLVLSSQLSWKR